MPYRAQFAFAPAPPGWRDEDFVYVFNVLNTPALGVGLLPGETLLSIPLPLEVDADFRVRSIEVIDPSGVLGVRFRDAFGTLLSEDQGFLPSQDYEVSGRSVPLEPELYCPAGSTLTLDVVNTA